MSRPSAVENEARLDALAASGLLDTLPERGFDDIVHLARRLCAAPVALVSLVDRERQWFKARAGFPPCETDLDRSVCKFVLAETDILQIPDLTRDPRTRDNPLVTGAPHLRFYAGAPLRTPEGHALGSLCVIDHAPRPGGLTIAQADDLRTLARQVMDQLLLRRALAERNRADRQREVVARTLEEVAAAGGDLDASLRAALAGAMRAVPAAEAGAVEILDGDSLVYRSVTDGLAAHLGRRLPLDGSLAGACLRADRPLLVPDARRDARAKLGIIESLRLRSCVMVPVRRGGIPIGVLKLQASRPGAFSEEDLRVAEILAGTVAAGLAEAGEETALRAVKREERRYSAVFDSAIDHAIVVMDREGRITEWNEGATRILGWTPDEVRGGPADLFFTPEDREAGIPAREMEEALRTGSGNDERWHLRQDGTRFFASGEMMVLREEDGRMIGFLKILRDRTERHEAGQRLEASRQRYRLAARATKDAIWDWDLATDHVLWNEALQDAYWHAPDRVEPTGDWLIAHIHPDDRARVTQRIRAVIDGRGTAWSDEYRFLRADGSYAEVLDRGSVIRDAEGRAVRMIGAMLDLTERKRGQQALQASEASLRAVLDTVPVGILFAEAPSGRIIGGNRRLEEIFRHPVLPSPDTDSYGEWVAFHEDGRRVAPHEYPLSRIIRDGAEHAALECHYQRGDGTRVWVEIVGVPMRDANGGLSGGVVAVADVDARRKAEAHQELLNHELSHRMKNLLAMVQAIAASTLRGATDIDAAREVLGSRLVALGKAHDMLLGGAAESAPLSAVVREGVGVQEASGDRVSFHGPEVDIGGKAALSLALTLHELTTNAVKYGALSIPGGRVSLTASLVEAEAGPALRLAWTESGGPPVVAPSRKGFGSRLIERGLTAQVGARLSLDYPREGAICVIEAPLANFQSVA
ncbi:PAS domain S-box protein [Methylobacterium terricola]|uniref:Blue-light-activated histidine kinase n=1 Tax=Methylobacterium terricola TaxID=2583531 RepID=A0A5C4LIQ1_9HYPH|nr:PAS domain S-box protein [Methylobacterium terricola]